MSCDYNPQIINLARNNGINKTAYVPKINFT